MTAEVEAIIAKAGLSDTVKLAGWLGSDEVKSHLMNSRAMVLPSFAEGLPVVIMEALALETPVIVTAIAGTPELVDETCGWVITSGSTEALANAMIEALEAAPARLERLGRRARWAVGAWVSLRLCSLGGPLSVPNAFVGPGASGGSSAAAGKMAKTWQPAQLSKRFAASKPPASSKLIIAPKPPSICCAAIAWPGWSGRPG